MDHETFYEKLAKLMQKSRKALRLYSSAGRMQSNDSSSEYSEIQVREWRDINSELLRQLSFVLERPHSRTMVSEVVTIRDYFYKCWRETEVEVHQRQKDLIAASENSDFVKASISAQQLVSLKARMQAAQAAHHEFNEVIRRSRVAPVEDNRETIELSDEQVVADAPRAKVIPLRRA